MSILPVTSRLTDKIILFPRMILIICCLVIGVSSDYQIVQAGEWCGTGGKSLRGALSKLIPEYYPPSSNKKCLFRQAPLKNACRKHDECYWNLNRKKEECDNRFPHDLKIECNTLIKPFDLFGFKIPAPADCMRLKAKCLGIATVYNKGMRAAQGTSYEEGQKEANEIYEAVIKKIGQKKFDLDRSAHFDSIAILCAKYNRDSFCEIDIVLKKMTINMDANLTNIFQK